MLKNIKMPDGDGLPKTVLLAEDDDDDYLIFSLAVKELSFEVTLSWAENGDILMEKLNKNIPDFLFLDLDMPCKDGRTCITELRQNNKFKNLKTNIYSSFTDIRNIEFCRQLRAKFYIIKPSSVFELTHILEKVLAVELPNRMDYPEMAQFVIKGA